MAALFYDILGEKMLGIKAGNRLKLDCFADDYVVFDLETTGVSSAHDEVIEISALRVRARAVTDEFSMLVNPGRPIPPAASRINGITDDMVKDSPDFEPALDAFISFAGDDILVGHNIASFDMKFLWRDARRYWGRPIENDFIDTLPLSRRWLPGVEKHTLQFLAQHYGIATDGAHRALFDCRMNQLVYEALRNECNISQSNRR